MTLTPPSTDNSENTATLAQVEPMRLMRLTALRRESLALVRFGDASISPCLVRLGLGLQLINSLKPRPPGTRATFTSIISIV